MRLVHYLLLSLLLLSPGCKPVKQDIIMTVNGPVDAVAAGKWLTHEHVLVDFIGADSIGPGRYDRQSVVGKVRPYLEEAKQRGCNFFVECTPVWLGRDPLLLKALSDSTGMQILTNTGFYGAVNNKFIHNDVKSMSAEEMSAIWTDEWLNGIGGTTIRPGFIKIAVERAPLSDFHRVLVKAAALTHLRTGLTIASHTGPAVAAFQELDILKKEGVSPEAFIWVHSHEEKDFSKLAEAASQGTWVSFDKLNDDNTEEFITVLKFMKSRHLLNKVLLSHDAGWYDPMKVDGGSFRHFNTLFDKLIPEMEKEGFTREEIDLIVEKNPVNAFAVRVRSLEKKK
ncbi:MAG: hypothetical protein U0X39_08570 [Bacteroidales bacterium]